jgi:Tfp pilus assembly protein PilO
MPCSDSQLYSWQVAPQQSLLPLPTDLVKVMDYNGYTSRQQSIIAYSANKKSKEKKKQKKKEEKEMGYRPSIFFC